MASGHLVNRFYNSSKDTLVLTLLVKNEADIILDNIFFHYAKGVDFIIVTDNGSEDGTLEILEELEKACLIKLLKYDNYAQHTHVNRMGEIAVRQFGATILIHADADEFWNPVKWGKSLKRSFLNLGRPAILVNRHDVLPTPQSRDKPFPQKELNIITKHIYSKNAEKDSLKVSMFLLWLPPKVMFSTKNGPKSVGIGNHLLAGDNSGDVTDEIIIFHFPFKSEQRFKEKVILAGKATTSLKTAKSTWWHWKRWFRQYQNGKLNKEIELLIPDLSKIDGIKYKPFSYNRRIITPIKRKPRLWLQYRSYKKHFAKVN